jgi:hypothetical protein
MNYEGKFNLKCKKYAKINVACNDTKAISTRIYGALKCFKLGL